MHVFRPYQQVPKISIFGSARTQEEHPHYQAAVQFSRLISQAGWMVITGAGGGIMQAGLVGPGKKASFGVAIRLPFETAANQIIAGDEKLVMFRYFFTRKLMFVKEAHAVALFPGGFGTHDEGFEVLTLIQTGKAATIPVVMVDEPNGEYWAHWNEYVRKQLLGNGMISPEDLHLYFITNDPCKAIDHVLTFYRNYDSHRYVRDRLVIRVKHQPTAEQVELLNEQFSDLVAKGRIELSGPLDGELAHLDLPRLKFHFNKRSYGRLRLFIDRLNDFAPPCSTPRASSP